MWCWRMQNIKWTDYVTNEAVSQRVQGEWNILQTIKRMKADWIGHILSRTALYNMLLKERHKGQEDEEEDMSSYWRTLRKVEILETETGSTRSHSVAKMLRR